MESSCIRRRWKILSNDLRLGMEALQYESTVHSKIKCLLVGSIWLPMGEGVIYRLQREYTLN